MLALLAVSGKPFRYPFNLPHLFVFLSTCAFRNCSYVYAHCTAQHTWSFQERVKAWQSWQGVQRDLNKRREAKVKPDPQCDLTCSRHISKLYKIYPYLFSRRWKLNLEASRIEWILWDRRLQRMRDRLNISFFNNCLIILCFRLIWPKRTLRRFPG